MMGMVKRSFFWGPGVLTENLMEEYREGSNAGRRPVQYFEKSRMEINNLNGNRNDPFFVTNGLLSVELITGEMQVGNNEFRYRWPAEIPLASDPDDTSAPTYASFRGAYARKDATQFSGKVVTAQIFRNGTIDLEHGGPGYANLDRFNVRNVHIVSETVHNIPDVFWTFLNQSGPVYSEARGEVRTEQLIQPWFYATGYPITEAYWTSAKIEGKPGTPVLVQAFQRRILTYVPSAPEGFKVQMGNIGQHYYDWRYNDAGKSPALLGECAETPKLGFGKLYDSADRIKARLGCAMGAEFPATVRRQRFEGGEMIGVVTLNFYSGRYFEDVFALYNDGTVRSFPFLSTEGAAGTPVVIPPGQHPVHGNFATALKSDGVTARLLGQATAPAETATYYPETKAGGLPVQYFDGGLMVYPNLAQKKIYILSNASGYAYTFQGPHVRHTHIDRWSAHDDTFAP
jgi:hypothetical protein